MDALPDCFLATAARAQSNYTTPYAITTLAGSASGTGSATGTAARFYYPYAVAVDGSGNLYVADDGNNTIRKITLGRSRDDARRRPGAQWKR